jgi:succinyl-CoA synthetase alpha subunit
MIISILILEPDPVTRKNVMIGEIGTQKQGETENEGEC